ncbi:MAG: type II toxin-antitoxin system VapC family toxin [Chromatiales bacterium]|nr:type II toxin-antitoxin system VapC family toxin [Chromatiales bacterium]
MSVVFDSSALLAIVFQEDGAEAAARRLSGAIVSAVNASEVVARLVDFGTSGEDARNALLNFGLDIRPFDAVLAVAAGQLRAATREKGLSLGDRACVALAIREQASVITADRAWTELDLGVEVELIR